MRALVRRLAIRHVLPWSWRRGDDRIAASLQRFALVESDSGWQFLRAVDVLEDPAHRARMFHDAVEEMGHAEGFARLAGAYASRPLPHAREARHALITEPSGLGPFLAYIAVGEADVYEEFEDYAVAAARADIQAHLADIREDEAGHQEDAAVTSAALVGGRERFVALCRAARWKRGWESCVRVSGWVGHATSAVLLSALWLVAAPLLSGPSRSRLRGTRHQVRA